MKRRAMTRRTPKRTMLAILLVNGALIATALATLFPLLWMISASLMPAGEALSLPPRLLPSRPTLDHYRAILGSLSFGRAFANSVWLASAITLISLCANSAAGYAFAKLRFRGRDRLFALLLATLVVPPQVGVLPLFLELKALGLVNSYGGVIAAGIATIFGIFLVRQAALAIPDELLDAARGQGRGVIVAAPHLGCWELLNLWLCTQGPMALLYRVPQHAEWEALLLDARGKIGATQIRADAAGVREGHASAVLAASIFHFGTYSIGEAKRHMAAAGIAMRLDG